MKVEIRQANGIWDNKWEVWADLLNGIYPDCAMTKCKTTRSMRSALQFAFTLSSQVQFGRTTYYKPA